MKHGQCARCVELAAEVDALKRHAQRAPVETIQLPLWAAEDLLKWMRKTNDRKPTLYPLGLENLLQALVSALTSTPDEPAQRAPKPITLHGLIEMFEAAGFDDKKAGQNSFENFSFIKFFEAYRSALTSTERCDGADDLEHLDGMLDDRERG